MFSDPFPTSDVSHKRQAGMLEYPRRSSELSSAQQHIEEDAIYFSRRAREERQAYLRDVAESAGGFIWNWPRPMSFALT